MVIILLTKSHMNINEFVGKTILISDRYYWLCMLIVLFPFIKYSILLFILFVLLIIYNSYCLLYSVLFFFIVLFFYHPTYSWRICIGRSQLFLSLSPSLIPCCSQLLVPALSLYYFLSLISLFLMKIYYSSAIVSMFIITIWYFEVHVISSIFLLSALLDWRVVIWVDAVFSEHDLYLGNVHCVLLPIRIVIHGACRYLRAYCWCAHMSWTIW